MKIRIIASKPDDYQDPITALIGREFEVERILRDDNNKPCGGLQIRADYDGTGVGEITINPGEYEEVK